MSVVLKNIGQIVGFTQSSLSGEVYLKDGRICSKEDACADGDPRVIDCRDWTLVPGFVDLHGSLQSPLADGDAAVTGGFTTVVQTIGQHNAPHNVSTYHAATQAVVGAPCSVVVPGALTGGLNGETLSEMGRMSQAGARIMSHGAELVQSTQVLLRTFEYAERLGLRVFVRPGEYELEKNGVARFSDWSVIHGLPAVVAESEEIGVFRIAALARQSGAMVHLTHLSTRRGVDAVRTVQKDNPSITASTTVHHLALSQEMLPPYDGHSRFTPPLGTEQDCLALRNGIKEGVIVALASDHLPHPPRRKRCEFETAASGSISFESAFSSAMDALGDLRLVTQVLSVGPSRVLGYPLPSLDIGVCPDMVLVAPKERWTLSEDTVHSSETNTPMFGVSLVGRVKMTWVSGELVFETCVN